MRAVGLVVMMVLIGGASSLPAQEGELKSGGTSKDAGLKPAATGSEGAGTPRLRSGQAGARAYGPTTDPAYQHKLMPVPESVRLEAGQLRLEKTFRVGIARHRDARLERAIQDRKSVV